MTSSRKTEWRGPVARHTKLGSPGIVRQLLKGTGFALSALLVAVLGIGAYVYSDFMGSLNANAVTLEGQDTDPPKVDVLPNEEVNILVTGIDKCEAELLDDFGGRCTPEEVAAQEASFAGQLNDVNMVVHISPEPRRVTVISIPRDMMTARPECQAQDGTAVPGAEVDQFNSAYASGGLPCVVKSAQELTGLKMTHGAMMTWAGVIDITNAIGGVDVCVQQPISDPQHTGLELEAGEHTLVGMEALQFLRVRHGVGDGSDLSRIGNQQVYMSALVNKLVSEDTLGSVGKMLRLANAVVDNATLSTGLTDPLAMVQLGGAAASVPLEDYTFIQFPAIDYAADTNKVAPDFATWQIISDALAANQPIDLSGEEDATPGQEGEQPPAEEAAPPAEEGVENPDQGTENAGEGTENPDETDDSTVRLPESVRGSNADDEAACNPQQGLF